MAAEIKPLQMALGAYLPGNLGFYIDLMHSDEF